MRLSMLSILRCPGCRSSFELDAMPPAGGELLDGVLVCRGEPRHRFAVHSGVPRLLQADAELARTARAFGALWRGHAAGRFESTRIYGRTADEELATLLSRLAMSLKEIPGTTMLDAGCGSGRLVASVAEQGASLVVGMDVSDSVDIAYEATRHLDGVLIVQANLLSPPFDAGIFDLVNCDGVLHHTADPGRGFRSLARLLRPGGRMHVWVYARGRSAFRTVRDTLRAADRLPPRVLMPLSEIFGSITWIWYKLARVDLPRRDRGEISFRYLDNLLAPIQHRHTADEVRRWFEEAALSNITRNRDGTRGISYRGDRLEPVVHEPTRRGSAHDAEAASSAG